MRCFLHRVLVLVAVYQHSNLRCASQALWTSYTDTITATCATARHAREIRSLLRVCTDCITHQRHYLNCLSKKPTLPMRDLAKPCGWIISTENGNSQTEWKIRVHHRFALLLSFEEFNLPMPFGKCEKLQGMEHLILDNHGEDHNSRTDQSSAIYYCGRRSPFKLIRRSNSLVVNYLDLSSSLIENQGVTSNSRIGNFLLHYQVCESSYSFPDAEDMAHVITHSTLAEQTVKFMLTIGGLSHKSTLSSSGKQKYSVHFLGERMRVLDLGLTFRVISKRDFKVHIFEGSRSAEVYRHSDEAFLLLGEMVYFVAFQGLAKIECVQFQCRNIQFYYFWSLVHDFSVGILIHDKLTIQYPPFLCEKHVNKLLHCAYILKSVDGSNMRIAFDDISFEGPDFMGSLSEEHPCTLAGVSVADRLRHATIKGASFPFQTDGDTSREFVVNTIFPEVTSCYKVLHRNKETKLMDSTLPTEHFVSTSGSIVLVVYAYEAYLEKVSFKLRVTLTSCVGVMTGCYHIPSDAYAQIADTQLYTWESRYKIKPGFCKFGNFLFVDFPATYTTFVEIGVQLAFCTNTKQQSTSITVVSLLSNEQKDKCLEIQFNPYSQLETDNGHPKEKQRRT